MIHRCLGHMTTQHVQHVIYLNLMMKDTTISVRQIVGMTQTEEKDVVSKWRDIVSCSLWHCHFSQNNHNNDWLTRTPPGVSESQSPALHAQQLRRSNDEHTHEQFAGSYFWGQWLIVGFMSCQCCVPQILVFRPPVSSPRSQQRSLFSRLFAPFSHFSCTDCFVIMHTL